MQVERGEHADVVDRAVIFSDTLENDFAKGPQRSRLPAGNAPSEPPQQDKIESLIGEMIGIVQHIAGTLAAYGEKLSAGDVIITGSIVPPPMMEPDETEFGYRLEPIGELMVRFSH